MIDDNKFKFIQTLKKEADDCYRRGDNENGDAITWSIFDQIHPGLMEYTQNNHKALYELIIMKNSSDKVIAGHAQAIIRYLKDKGVEF